MIEKIAIATCPEFPELSDDDRPLLRSLTAAGLAFVPVPWQSGADWNGYAAVLLRSVWDYYRNATAFAAWLDELDRRGVPCWNPTSLVRWNMDKQYLRDLEARGIPIVPTLWLDREDGRTPEENAARIRDTGWTDMVLKPTVSGGAWRTTRLRAEEVADRADDLRDGLAVGPLMLQPFMPEIVEQGELSLVFFDGELSHSIRKRARPGDFRVQWTHGGTQALEAPPATIIEQARAVLEAAPEPGLYARVDGVVRDGRLILMELEQIEPYLYFAEEPGAPDRFVRALLRRL